METESKSQVNGENEVTNGIDENTLNENGESTEVKEVKPERKTYKYKDPPILFTDVSVSYWNSIHC